MKKHLRADRGFSMMETVIATAIIGIFFVGAVSSFKFISKAIMTSRTRTVATNLAQERIESLKNVTYSRLHVTKAEDCSDFGYDNSFFPPEQGILVGDIPYERRILIQRAQENASGDLEVVPPGDGDTGLKKITATVVWQEESGPKYFSFSNVREDPNRRPLDGTLTGVISGNMISGSTVLLEGAKIAVVDNLNWNTMTDAAGKYTLQVPTGTYKINVTRNGFWDYSSSSITVTNTPTTHNVTLQEKATGNATGYVYINAHPVISQVVASSMTTVVGGAGTVDASVEWVELFNPTTFPWLMNASTFAMDRYTTSSVQPFSIGFSSPAIQPNGYYLIASTPTFVVNNSTLTADATYYYASGYGMIEAGSKIGIAIKFNGLTVDRAGWGNGGGPASEGREGSPIGSALTTNGDAHVRKTVYNDAAPGNGNAFDSDENSFDFLANRSVATYPPHTSATFGVPTVSGSPAYGAIVTCNDGVSIASSAICDSSSRRALFSLPHIATGAYTVSVTSNTGIFAGYATKDITLTANGQTIPLGDVFLSSEAVYGYAAGRVINGNTNAGINGIKVAEGTAFTYTNSTGRYVLPLEAGIGHTIVANPDNENSSYVSASRENVAITAGVFTYEDFSLLPGGSITGRVKSSAGDNLPNVSMTAKDIYGNEAGTAITDANGLYVIPDLSAANFTVQPLLDTKETSSPASVSISVGAGTTKWVSTFTVTGYYGTISGTVKNNGAPIGTGVLIIASTSTVLPEEITNTIRGGGTLYYSTVSHSDGTFSLQVRGGVNYNIYAWYTTMSSNGTVLTTQKFSLNRSVAAGGTTTVPFTWP